MDIEKLINAVKLCGSTPKVYQCKQCAYWAGGDMSKCIPKMTEEAATALETLHAENRRLNELICSIPTTPDSGRTIGEYDKEMSMCAFLDDLEAENKSLRAENVTMEKQLNEFSEFLCHMTGGLLSKTYYTAQEMIGAAEDYQQRICDSDCDIRADLAAIEDILGDEYEVDDLVPVVRCKECKFWKRDNEKVGHCYLLDETKPTDYCSDGQREKWQRER